MGLSLFSVAPVMAQTSTYVSADSLMGTGVGANLGLPEGDVRVTVARIIRVAMGLLGIIAVCIILIGGFTWMTAGGNDEKVGEAKKWIFSGVIGLAIILSAYAIATFVIGSLVNATTAPAGTVFTP
jgi:hypothetical protein